MKRAVIVLLTLCMLCATLVLPASAEMAADQSLADVIASGAEHLKLTHANHVEDTDPIDTATGAGDESEKPSESKPAEKEQGGCGSLIGTAVMLPMLLAAFAYRKKD